MERIFLYKSYNTTVSYDDKNWYVNEISQAEEGACSIDELRTQAQDKAYSLMKELVITYCSNFRNLAILTAAGTSMENGENGGKTRTELWASYKDDIIEIRNIIAESNAGAAAKCDEIIESKNIENFLSFVILLSLIHI